VTRKAEPGFDAGFGQGSRFLPSKAERNRFAPFRPGRMECEPRRDLGGGIGPHQCVRRFGCAARRNVHTGTSRALVEAARLPFPCRVGRSTGNRAQTSRNRSAQRPAQRHDFTSMPSRRENPGSDCRRQRRRLAVIKQLFLGERYGTEVAGTGMHALQTLRDSPFRMSPLLRHRIARHGRL